MLVVGSDGQIESAVVWAVSKFGAAVKERLAGPGQPEDQLRGPLEIMLASVAAELNIHLTPHGEASLRDVGIRPDYAIAVNKAVIGYVEVKAPGKGADPERWSKNGHDYKQWAKLAPLPNVLYTDGQEWALYRSGERVGDVVRLKGDLATDGSALTPADGSLARVLTAFLRWAPNPPRNVSMLVESVAGLCRLLRDEVTEAMALSTSGRSRRGKAKSPFVRLAKDWRKLLFPDATDSEFADQYAQTVTFALLLARLDGVDLTGRSLHDIATDVGKRHSLMGKALAVLTDESAGTLSVVMDTLVQVIAAVDWPKISRGEDAQAVLHLYEHFLGVYDPKLRRESGAYYTPTDVVSCMVRLTDTLLRERMDQALGFASDGVVTIDPAMGTGTFLLNIIETAAQRVGAEQGEPAVGPALRAMAKRLIGFEKQTGPYAVAETRAMQALAGHGAVPSPDEELRLYVTDTLDNAWHAEADLGYAYEAIARSRRRANRIKREERVQVVIGNPPYRERAKPFGGWVVNGRDNDERGPWKPLDDYRAQGHGRWEQNLNNLYVYFWRWATWKVFDANPEAPSGIVAFITTSGYLTGPGFAGMREYLRRTADEGWIIDLSPEGHRPDVSTRVFQGVQQPICIGIFVRYGPPSRQTPAAVHHIAVHGRREEKFTRLKTLALDDPGWANAAPGWQAAFTPDLSDQWKAMPALADLLPWSSPGVTANRSWPYAPDQETLLRRWDELISAPTPAKREALLKRTDARDVRRLLTPLRGQPERPKALQDEDSPCVPPVKMGWRSFDTQYVIPDIRLLDRPRPDLWAIQSDHQIWVTEQRDQPTGPGPAVTFTAYLPDLHHYAGRGGRAIPLWLDGETAPNMAPGLPTFLTERIGVPINAQDLFCYIAAVTAHSGFSETYQTELSSAGSIRVPLTTDPTLFAEAVLLGREVLCLHTDGERFPGAVSQAGGKKPRLSGDRAPKVVQKIPDTPEDWPDTIDHDPETETLYIGTGAIRPVPKEVWEYEVTGMRIVRKWFGYRRKTTAAKWSSPLSDIRPSHWSARETADLLVLLHVLALVVEREPAQMDLLNRIRTSTLVSIADLDARGLLGHPAAPVVSDAVPHLPY